MQIRSMIPGDWPEVARIYNEGIATGCATFETRIPAWKDWDQNHLPFGRLVSAEGETLLGWAALSPVSSRCVYGGVAEVSVYVGQDARGRGIGESLLRSLIEESERNGIWTLQSGIFPENLPSIRLHDNTGFRRIGYRERIGCLNGVWKDNVLYERRSHRVGTTAFQ